MNHSITFGAGNNTRNTWTNWKLLPESPPVVPPPTVANPTGLLASNTDICACRDREVVSKNIRYVLFICSLNIFLFWFVK